MKSNDLQVLLNHLETTKNYSYPDLNKPAREALDYAISLAQRYKNELVCQEYRDKLLAFKSSIENLMADGLDGDDTQQRIFYETKWTIGFGDNFIMIDNGADVYNAVVDMIDTELENL